MLERAVNYVRYVGRRIAAAIQRLHRRLFKRAAIHRAASAAAEWWGVRLNWGEKSALAASLIPLIEEEMISNGICWLTCDYQPLGLLADALVLASIPSIQFGGHTAGQQPVFPLKHSLFVSCEELQPKEGYGNWTAVIRLQD